MGTALGIVYRSIATHLTHKAGYKKSTAHTGAVSLIHGFVSALNLNIHFYMLFLDGVDLGEAGSSVISVRRNSSIPFAAEPYISEVPSL